MTLTLLKVLIGIVCVLIISLWALMLIARALRYRDDRRHVEIRSLLGELLGSIATADVSNRQAQVQELRSLTSGVKGRRYLIDQLRLVQDYFSLPHLSSELLDRLGIDSALVASLHQKGNMHRARAVVNLYETDSLIPEDMLDKYIAHDHIYLRRESQIALIKQRGWAALPHLSASTRRMTMWQQIRIIEKLTTYFPVAQKDLLLEAWNQGDESLRMLCARLADSFDLLPEMHGMLLEGAFSDDKRLSDLCVTLLRNLDGNLQPESMPISIYSAHPNYINISKRLAL